ncbi:hypothetical protein CIB48_g44 [Xylaria polymorpha]|nr:hypothetical protein CIB48_g44 [Xylaria polymorpha]
MVRGRQRRYPSFHDLGALLRRERLSHDRKYNGYQRGEARRAILLLVVSVECGRSLNLTAVDYGASDIVHGVGGYSEA